MEKRVYKVGETINIGYYGGFRNQTFIKAQAEVTNVSGNMITIKVFCSNGGYKRMFGYDYQLAKMEDNYTNG